VIGARHGPAVGRGVDSARQHRVGRYAAACHFQSDGPDERVQRRLGDGIGAEVGGRLHPGARSHGDDPSAARFQHRRQHLADHVERGAQVQVHHPIPDLVGRLADRCTAGEPAHDMDQRIHRPRARGRATATFHRGQVRLNRMEVSLRQAASVPRTRHPEDGGCSAVEKRLYYRRPQPARCASHQNHHAILMIMPQQLPRLRMELDFTPSPDPQRPGLYIRDPYHFSDAMLLVPPPLVASLACFDGEQTELDLRASLVRATGEIQVGDLEKHLLDRLSEAGFLVDERFLAMRDAAMKQFAQAERRNALHAGAGYPDQPEEARRQLAVYMGSAALSAAADGLLGIAAPHVSPFGGWESYRDAYNKLAPDLAERVFVILGTSHYGEPDKFGLTRKPFVTPLGEAVTETELVNRLEQKAGAAVTMEDYCHAIEHSIEFQVLFLQYLYGPHIRILPILCGAYARSIYQGGRPEQNEAVQRFLGELGEMAERERDGLFWVLGIDMAHMGRRYGDPRVARADQDQMTEVARRDHARIDRVVNADAEGFWSLVQENHDDLKWCGSSPLYTFLRAVPGVRGQLARYQQWNIDEQSVVSFAALTFTRS